jgi:hypothetical protein
MYVKVSTTRIAYPGKILVEVFSVFSVVQASASSSAMSKRASPWGNTQESDHGVRRGRA